MSRQKGETMATRGRIDLASDHRDEAREWPDVTPRWSDDDMVAAFMAGEENERHRAGKAVP